MVFFNTVSYRERLANAGHQLGLAHDGNKNLAGTWRGIEVGVRLWSTRTNDNTNYYTTVHAAFPAPLRMSLDAVEDNAVSRFFRQAFDQPEVFTGNAGFDQAFRLRGNDAARVQQLFADRRLTDSMQRVGGQRRWYVSMDDERVHARISGWRCKVDVLTQLLDGVAAVGAEVARRREEIPRSAAEQQAASGLTALAGKRRWGFDEGNLRTHGQIGRSAAWVRAYYHSRDAFWTTEFDVRFPQPLGIGLDVQRSVGVWSSIKKFFGSQDIEVGHPAFDQEFVVKGGPDDKVQEVLGGDVARRIMELHPVARELQVGDLGICAVAPGLVHDLQSLEASLTIVNDLAEAMLTRVMPRGAPYR